jgi:hypothetical protein
MVNITPYADDLTAIATNNAMSKRLRGTQRGY